jgi:hypothetical protein
MDSLPPTPTHEELIQLEHPTRTSSKPICLHYSVDKKFFELQYPNHFYYCGHREDYVEAMLRSANKNAIKGNSRRLSCQGGHKRYISPASMLKIEKSSHRLYKTVLEDDENKSNNVESIASRTIDKAINSPSTRAVATSQHYLIV